MTTASFTQQRSPSLEKFQATMSGLLRPCRIGRQFGCVYNTEIRHGQMRPFSVTPLQVGGRARINVDPHENMPLLQVPLEGDFVSRSRSGEDVAYRTGRNAQLVHARSAMDLEFGPTTRMMIFKLREAQLDMLGGRANVEQNVPRSLSISLESLAGQAFNNLCRIAARDIDGGRIVVTNDLSTRLEDWLVKTLTVAFTDEPLRGDGGGVPHHIRRAERYMMDNLAEPLNLDAIVRAAGTSARTLHRTFKQVRGDTPLNVLKNMRLERVHSELTRGTGASGDITRIAMKWGFNHMGLFAADYRHRYGVSPSAARKLQS